MTDNSVSPHAQIWAQAFDSAPQDGDPVAPRNDNDNATTPAPAADAGLYYEFPTMPGNEPEPLPAVLDEEVDTTDFDDLFTDDAPQSDDTSATDDTPAPPAEGDSDQQGTDHALPPLPTFEAALPEEPPTQASPPVLPAPTPDTSDEVNISAAPATPPPTGHAPRNKVRQSPSPTSGSDHPAEGTTPQTSPAAPAQPSERERARTLNMYAKRFEESVRLQPYVTHLQSFVSSQQQITDLVRTFELTSDRAVDIHQQRAMVDALSAALVRAPSDVSGKLPPKEQMENVLEMLYDDLIGIGPLGPLWRDPDVTEIIVRGADTVLVERAGQQLERDLAHFRDLEHLQSTARNLSHKVSGRALSPTSPLVTAELPGARVQFVYTPLTRDGVFIAIRKFRPMLTMSALIDNASLTTEMAEFLSDLVKARATIVVSGGTGSGKTSMVNALSEFIDRDEHVVTIEDSYELKLDHPNVTSMQTKEKASADDTLLISQADLLVASLRMRPDRIVVGEIREGSGADTMMRAAGTGHDGSMTTIHANSAESAVSQRLPDLLLEHKQIPMDTARRSVANAIDAVVHVTKRLGRRYVTEISVLDTAMVNPNGLPPQTVFSYDGYTAHRVGGVDATSELGIRMYEAGVLDRWRAER